MDDQIEQIFKVKQRQGEKISLLKLRHKPKQDKVDQETMDRLEKLKKYAIHDTSIPTQKLNSYYCSLCGRISLVTNIYLQDMPKRQTDSSIAIDLRGNFIKPNFQKQKIKHLKRQNGIQTQHRWKCECGIPIGYTSISYEQFQSIRHNDEYKSSNRPFIYIYEGSLTQKMKESKLVSQLITYKQTILLHLKKKITKK